MRLLLVTASWCHWCPEMKRTLAALGEKYPAIEVEEVDADSKLGKRLSKLHGVKSLPTVLGFAAPATGSEQEADSRAALADAGKAPGRPRAALPASLEQEPFWRFVGADSLAAVERDLRRTPEGKAVLGPTKTAAKGRKAAPAAGRK